MSERETQERAGYWGLVVAQFGAMLYLAFTGPAFGEGWASRCLIVLGGVLGVWAVLTMGIGRFNVTPELRPDARLVTSGPYRFLRHPMYVAVVLVGMGWLLARPVWSRVLAFVVLAVVVLVKARIEERLLSERFS